MEWNQQVAINRNVDISYTGGKGEKKEKKKRFRDNQSINNSSNNRA